MKNKKRFLAITLALFLSISSIIALPFTSYTKVVYGENNDYIDHEIIVITNNIDYLNVDNTNYEIIGQIDENDIVLIHNDELSTKELIDLYKNRKGILNVEPNYVIERNEDISDESKIEKVILENTKLKDGTAYQWSMNNDGHMFGKGNGVDMNYSSWKNQEIDPNLKEVVVAVIDSGVDGSNSDIPMWEDPGNIGLLGTYPNADKHGYDDMGISSYEYLTRNHGTHCAGIIGALWNGEGTSGVSSNVKIMSVKHSDSFASFVRCYEYVIKACEAGVNICATSNSWGIGAFHSYILDSLVRTLGEKYNVVSVFSAGNSFNDDDVISSNPSVLADNPYVIIVGAMNPDGSKSEFSSYGQATVDIFAPGTMILSTDFYDGCGSEWFMGYYPEMDNHTVLRQSFDNNSIPLSNTNNFTFNNMEGSYITDKLSFDGDKCLCIPYETLKNYSSKYPNSVLISTDVVDLSSIEEKPAYFGIKVLPTKNERLDFSFIKFSLPLIDGSVYSQIFDETYTTSANGWNGAYISLEDIDDIDWEKFYISIDMKLENDNSKCKEGYDLYVDMVSMGNDVVPYTYMSGTSMACPTVVGEVAVIRGKYPTLSAKEVVARVLCGTNQKDEYSFEGLCTTGEMANVDKALGNELTPFISKISKLNDNYIKIDGLFMNEVDSIKYRLENSNTYKSAEIISNHHNSIIAKISDDAKGNIDFIATNSYGKSPLVRTKIDTNPNYKYYDNYDIPLPKEVEDELSTWNGWTAQVYDNNIYFLLQTAEDSNIPEVTPSKFIRYNTSDSSFDIISFPQEILKQANIESIICYSATTHDDKLFFFIIGKRDGSEYVDQFSIISLNKDETWQLEKAFEDMSVIRDQNFTLIDKDNELVVVGSAYLHSIMMWSDEENRYVSVGNCENRAPNALFHNSKIWVAGGTIAGFANQTESGVAYYEIDKDEDGNDFYEKKGIIEFEEFVEKNKDQYYGIAAIKEGIIAVGPASKDKTSDTYFIPVFKDGSIGQAKSLNIRVYDGPLYKPACATIGNDLYVLAATSNHRHVFSSTKLNFNRPKPTPTPIPVPYVVPNTCVKYIY